jgi:hypothetical protein
VFISGAAIGDYLDLGTLGTCGGAGSSVILAGGATYIGTRCASATRANLILVAPRASTLGPPVVLLGNVALARGVVIESNAERVIVAERVTNPDDRALPGTYELVSIDLATRAIVRRMPLPGIGDVASIQYAGGAPGRVLIVSGSDLAEGPLFLADILAGTVQLVGTSGAPFFGTLYSMVSPDGRFIIDRFAFIGSVQGFDVENPGPLLPLWAPTDPFDYPASLQFAQQPGATLLAGVRNIALDQYAIWAVPLDAPQSARELTRFPAPPTPLPDLVRGDLLVHGAAAANPLASEIRLLRVSTGEQLGLLSPPGGIENLDSLESFNGNVLLFTVLDAQQRRRAAFIRRAAPGIVHWIAPDLELAPFSPVRIDDGETTIGFTAIDANSRVPYLVDVNLPSAPSKVTAGIAAGQQADVALVLGAPGL